MTTRGQLDESCDRRQQQYLLTTTASRQSNSIIHFNSSFSRFIQTKCNSDQRPQTFKFLMIIEFIEMDDAKKIVLVIAELRVRRGAP